ncbi:orotidine-5'-phosphate decarboxylase [archaeon SCG-AAA382B04]|nr:orotidine-5'-phosphate decarboxylase [archaeon SCG-AAA382B04]
MNNEKGLIFACDLQDREKAIEITKKVKKYIDGVKVNYPLILSSDINIISKLSRYAPVISDFKIADVPHINKIICKKAFENGAQGVISHSFLGKKSLEVCREVADSYNSELFSVVEMSHSGAEKFIHPKVDDLCELSKKVGVDGVIAPGNDAKRLRKVRNLLGKNLDILSPGVGFQGGEVENALEAGANFIIVGRKIYRSNKPKEVAKELKDKINNF